MKKAITNLAASVHARLLNRAKAEGRPFNELLQYYAMERLLYRLSQSDHAERFVLKGALMLQFWGGVRVRCCANLGNARIPLQIDIGFGDVITPGALKVVYPTLLDFAAPRLLGYTPETSIAEKFEAMVILDMANTRLKDFLDIWVLAQGQEFRGDVLANAIKTTFLRRRTPLPQFTPIALTPSFPLGIA